MIYTIGAQGDLKCIKRSKKYERSYHVCVDVGDESIDEIKRFFPKPGEIVTFKTISYLVLSVKIIARTGSKYVFDVILTFVEPGKL